MRRRPVRDTWPEPITAQPNDFAGPGGTVRTMSLDALERRLLGADRVRRRRIRPPR